MIAESSTTVRQYSCVTSVATWASPTYPLTVLVLSSSNEAKELSKSSFAVVEPCNTICSIIGMYRVGSSLCRTFELLFQEFKAFLFLHLSESLLHNIEEISYSVTLVPVTTHIWSLVAYVVRYGSVRQGL